MQNNCRQNRNQKKIISRTPVRVRPRPLQPQPEASPPDPRHFWIESPEPNGYRVSLVGVSESSSQTVEVPTKNFEFTKSSLRILSTKSTRDR